MLHTQIDPAALIDAAARVQRLGSTLAIARAALEREPRYTTQVF